jgi:hypothetical protein
VSRGFYLNSEDESVDVKLVDGTVFELYGDGTFELVKDGGRRRVRGVDRVQDLPTQDLR